MTASRHRLKALATLVLAFASISTVAAQQASFSNLSTKKTYLQVQKSKMNLDGVLVEVFSPVSVTCPGGNGNCVVRVEVSAETFAIPPGESILAEALVDGYPIAPGSVGFSSNAATVVAYGTNTFSWVVGGVPPGQHVVTVRFNGPDGSTVEERVLTIEVFKD